MPSLALRSHSHLSLSLETGVSKLGPWHGKDCGQTMYLLMVPTARDFLEHFVLLQLLILLD